MRTHRRAWAAAALALCAAVLCTAAALLPAPLRRGLLPPDPVRERRALSGFSSRSSITVGIAGPMEDIRDTNLFLEGVEMAVEDCNASCLLPIPLKTVLADDRNAISDVLTVAGQLARDPQVAAVIGHWGSEFTMAAAQIYEQAGLLMLTPVSTNPALTRSELRLVLRSVPSDDAVGALLAGYAKRQGLGRVAVLYTDDMTGLHVARAFESAADREGVEVLDKRVMYADLEQLDRDYRRWREQGLDALVVADIITRNTELIRHVIALDPTLPILATDAYDYGVPLRRLSGQAQSLHVATFFNPDAGGTAYRDFRDAFVRRYGREPDFWALQGYDSVTLLYQAFYRAGSVDALRAAEALKDPDHPFAGAAGNAITFADNGDIAEPVVYVKQILNGEIRYWEEGEDGS